MISITRRPRAAAAILLLPAVTLLCSCAIFAPEQREPVGDVPSAFTLYSEAEPDLENRWWLHLQAPELNALLDEALTNSPSLEQVWARLAQSEAIAAKAGAARSPTLDYEGRAATARQKTTSGADPGTRSFDSFTLGVGAAYEVDLWGRVKSQSEAAALDRDATREALNAAAMTLASQTALRWIGLVAQRLQTALIEKQLEANKTSLELMELRFRRSLATALDVYQQRQAVAGTEARIPLAELREELLRHELALLLGRADFRSLRITTTNLPAFPEPPPVGVPAETLANRPDVRRAGLRLSAADWTVSAARADRLPALRITATGSYGHNDNAIAEVFDDWFANLAASITGPIFDGGRRKAEVARARAVVDERLAAYRETVLKAIKAVEDALVSEQKQRTYLLALDRNLTLRQASYREAVTRYRNGLINYLPVLVELVGLQNLERDHIEAQYQLWHYRINLYRALGGTWTDALQRN